MTMTPELIELKLKRPGFAHFIGSWVCCGNPTLVVDVGPLYAIGRLASSLREMGIDRVDYILLTHIHIDHAGGLAAFLENFPMARVICHEMGIAHLLDPAKLEAASRQVLGDLVDSYGPIRPVKKEYFIPHSEANINGLRIIETPGHAAHHLSFSYEGHLFAGEASGIYLNVAGKDYMRPATPPVFFLEQFAQSMDRLLALEDQVICYPHYGMNASSHAFLRKARRQLFFWKDIIGQEIQKNPVPSIPACLDLLLEMDASLSAYADMGKDEQARERSFMTHCIEGYLGYLAKRA